MRGLLHKHLLSLALTCCLLYCSCREKNFDPYNESNYKEISRGNYAGSDLYAIVFRNLVDTSYTLTRVYVDSTYNPNYYIQHFEYRGLKDGPMQLFTSGKSDSKELFKEGKRHGESIFLLNDSTVSERRLYDMGKKVGAWEYYDSHGRLFKKKYYKDDKFVKQEIYNPNGKLVRTEFEESTLY